MTDKKIELTKEAVRPLLLPAALVLVLAGLLATSAVLWQNRRDGTADQGAIVAARQEAANFFSLDYHHPGPDIDRVLAQATGKFKEQYAAKSSSLSQRLVANKIMLTAEVPDDGAALEYLHGDQAQVLVAVDVTTKAGTKASQNSRYRTRVDLLKVGDSWLIAGVNQVG